MQFQATPPTHQPAQGNTSPSFDAEGGEGDAASTAATGDVVQDLLAYAARCPLHVPDRANGCADPELPGVLRIPLVNTGGLYALIDAEDYPLVQRYRWRLGSPGGYAVVGVNVDNVRMHRLVLMVGPSLEVDHRSRETLDNRKANLRACTHAENMRNTKRPTTNSTGIKGVMRYGSGFRATVMTHGQKVRADFADLRLAEAWVTAKRIELHGDFARHE